MSTRWGVPTRDEVIAALVPAQRLPEPTQPWSVVIDADRVHWTRIGHRWHAIGRDPVPWSAIDAVEVVVP